MTTRSDTIVNKFWEDVGPGDKVRWATPRFVKYGVVISRDDESLTLSVWEEDKPRVIPHALWYFAQGKIDPHRDEHLVILEELPKNFSGLSGKLKPRQADAHEAYITVKSACELLNMDPKQLRRHIRNGVITATKNKDAQWLMNRDKLMARAAEYGWI